MSETTPDLILSQDSDGKPVVLVNGTESSVDTPAALAATAPTLTTPEALGKYCEALNHLARGLEYNVIHDPAAYAEKYRARLSAEDPNAPFVEGAPRLSDFGEIDLGELALPRVDGQTVVFFAEDDYLGIPYRVVGPASAEADGALQYEPLPAK